MANVSIKMGVTGVSTFKRDIGDAESAVKALTASLKVNENQLKLTGNQESYMSNKVKILKDRIAAQTKVVQEAEKALKDMNDNGVSKSSKEFQTMQTKVYNATSKLLGMKAELKDVETNGGQAAAGLNKTNESLKSLNRAKAWDNVADGIDRLSKKLERGARAAVNFGKKILGSVKESTGWADDLLTESMKYDIDPETLQRMQRVADIIDTDVDAIIGAKKRMSKAAAGEGAEDIMEMFGVDATGKNPDDLFWELGEALLGMSDAFDKEAAAQKVFGRNWNDLLPLFKRGRTEYEKMLAEQNVLTNEQVENLGKADDKIKQMEAEVAQLKNAFWSENADTITKLMQWIIDNSDSVKAGLAVIAGGFGLLKLGAFATSLGKTINGFQQLGLLKGAKTAAEAAGTGSTPGWAASAKTAAGGWLSQQLSLFSSAGGWATMGPLAGLLAGGAVGAAMINANLNDASYNKIFGDEEGMDLLDRMTAEQFRLAQEYEKVFQMAGSEEAYNAYDALKASLESSGFEHSDDAIGLLENIFQNRLNETDIDGMVEKYDKMSAVYAETSASQIQSNSEMTAAATELKGLPAAISAAVRNSMSGVTIVINESAVGAIGRKVGASMARGVQALVK